MAWRRGEVWFDMDFSWFRDQADDHIGGLALAGAARALDLREPPFLTPALSPGATGLEASRRRRTNAAAERRRKRATRTIPAAALVLGSATMLPIAALRDGGAQGATRMVEDPPSQTFQLPKKPAVTKVMPARTPPTRHERVARVDWNSARSIGLPYAGSLVGGTQLPVEGPDWVTWNPSTDSRPSLPSRLYGNERTIRAILTVLAGYREAHSQAPRVLIGDISRRDGGWMDQHVSHQNGLDVDVYYPRLDDRLAPPRTASQIDRRLAQDLLDRFLGTGAQIVFVGYSSGLRGASGVVVPYPNHENHMHVRFGPPRR